MIGVYQKIALVEIATDTSGETRVVDSFQITPSFGAVYYQSVDLGYPVFRSSVQDNPQQDGTINQTEFMGDRSVSIALTVRNNAFGSTPTDYGWDSSVGWNSSAWWVAYLSAWVTAARRVRLYLMDDLGREFWVPLVGASVSAPVAREAAWNRDMLLSFTCPTGKLYAFHEGDAVGSTRDGRLLRQIRQSSVQAQGLPFPVAFPLTFPAGAPPLIIDYGGTVANGVLLKINTLGTAMVHPKVTFTGPDNSQTSIEIDSTLEIAAGTIIEIDTNAKTIRSYPATDPTTVSDLDGYKAGPLTWPVLKPGYRLNAPRGRNTVDFSMTSGDANAVLQVIYNEALLL